MRRVESGGDGSPRVAVQPAVSLQASLPIRGGPAPATGPPGICPGPALGWLGSKPLTSLGSPGLLDPIKDGQGLMLLHRVGKGKAGWCLASACWSAGCCGLRLGLKTA